MIRNMLFHISVVLLIIGCGKYEDSIENPSPNNILVEVEAPQTNGWSTEGSMTGGKVWPNVKVWNFDTSSNTLTIGTTKLKVQREVDWEASPRKLTIVYSGVSGSKSFWGKKK